MDPILKVTLLGLVAGAAIPVGGWIARKENIRPNWLESEFRHFVIAFGGGALLAAVAFVLVPKGTEGLPIWLVILMMSAGGLSLMGLDLFLAKLESPSSQLAAMLVDFLPEAIALGAFLAYGEGGLLLAFIITLQNLPEGFNSYRELRSGLPSRRIMIVFCLLALLGPASTSFGYYFLSDFPELLKSLMVFASGGILYLVFQDIAPAARLDRHWLPSTGAVAGFLMGLVGHLLSH